jgi:hypothetical protein
VPLDAYRVALLVFGRIYACACGTCGHCLISVLAEVELLLVLVVMHTLDYLRSDKRCLCDDTLQRHHVVELVRAECAGVAGVFAEAANVGAVVYDIRAGLMLGAVGKGFNDTLERAIESFCEVERLVQETVGQLAVVCSDLVNADLEDVSPRCCM